MHDSQFKQDNCLNNIFLKWIVISINGKLYKKYRLDYEKEYTTGILSTISEYSPANNPSSVPYKIMEKLQKDVIETGEEDNDFNAGEYEENTFTFISPPEGRIDIMNYYSSFYDAEHLELSSIGKEELNSNLWSSQLIDLSGMGSNGMPGHFLYNWYRNRAFFSFKKIIPDLLSTLIVILVRYHKTLYQLITEINLYMVDNDYNNAQDNYCDLDIRSDLII